MSARFGREEVHRVPSPRDHTEDASLIGETAVVDNHVCVPGASIRRSTPVALQVLLMFLVCSDAATGQEVPEPALDPKVAKSMPSWELHLLKKADEAFQRKNYKVAEKLYDSFALERHSSKALPFAIIRRATRRAGVTTADKDHLHHRLMRLGHGQRRSVLILWSWTAILSAFVLYPAYTGEGNGAVPLGIAALGLALFTVLHPQLRRPRRLD